MINIVEITYASQETETSRQAIDVVTLGVKGLDGKSVYRITVDEGLKGTVDE